MEYDEYESLLLVSLALHEGRGDEWQVGTLKRLVTEGLGSESFWLHLGVFHLANTFSSISGSVNSECILLIAFSICFLIPVYLSGNLIHLFHIHLHLTHLNVIWRERNLKTFWI